MISDRIKVALKAAKARGKKLGSSRPGHWDGKEDRRIAGARAGAAASAASRLNQSREDYIDLMPTIISMRQSGATLQAIADAINQTGRSTAHGGRWQSITVLRLLKRHTDLETNSHIPTVLTPPINS